MAQSTPVTILLATCNGEAHLQSQLESIARQDHGRWQIIASDDGSEDATPAILEQFAQRFSGRVQLIKGPQRGMAENFISLLAQASEGPVAFCDQDDVWLPGKLSRALSAIGSEVRPVLYGCRTERITAGGATLGLSPLWRRGPSFGNALVQNIIGGHTAVMNAAALRLMQEAGRNIRVPFHDWWAYQVISGCGGRVIVDPAAMVRYRQHDGNLLGASRGPAARLRRLSMMLSGNFAPWFGQTEVALGAIRPMLTPAASDLLDRFSELRRTPGLGAARAVLAGGIVHRQRRIENLALALAAARGLI